MNHERRYALARPLLLSQESYARVTGVHPDLLRRLVALGLLEVRRDAEGRHWFEPSEVRSMARIQRLHLGLGLTYSSLGLVIDLLDRITELEHAQQRAASHGGERWI